MYLESVISLETKALADRYCVSEMLASENESSSTAAPPADNFKNNRSGKQWNIKKASIRSGGKFMTGRFTEMEQ
jgi:hypothetical protein